MAMAIQLRHVLITVPFFHSYIQQLNEFHVLRFPSSPVCCDLAAERVTLVE